MKVFTAGTFDLFHAGHVNFLKQCARLGEVSVILNSDSFVQRYKGEKPIMSFKERETILKSCKYVSEVLENAWGEDLRPMLSNRDFDIIAVGSDWACKDYFEQTNLTQPWLFEHNILLVYLQYTHGISSTRIKEQCLKLA